MWFLLWCFIFVHANDGQDHTITIPSLGKSIKRSPRQDAIAASSSVETNQRLADMMMISYFRENGERIRSKIRPYIMQHLSKQGITQNQSLQASLSESDDLTMDIINIVTQAIEDSMAATEERYTLALKEAKQELPRQRVAVITGIFSIISAGIGAAVSLAIALSSMS